MEAMDQLRGLMFEVKGELGHIGGQLAALVREVAALGARLEQHLEDDRRAHADQDQRLLQAAVQATAERAAIKERFEARVAALERGRAGDRGEQRMADRWRAAVFGIGAMISGFVGGIIGRLWPQH